jgi:predicted Zn-dependent protease
MPITKERKVIRGIIHKHCPHCNNYLPLTSFSRRTQSADDRQDYCKECSAEVLKEWRHKHMVRKNLKA